MISHRQARQKTRRLRQVALQPKHASESKHMHSMGLAFRTLLSAMATLRDVTTRHVVQALQRVLLLGCRQPCARRPTLSDSPLGPTWLLKSLKHPPSRPCFRQCAMCVCDVIVSGRSRPRGGPVRSRVRGGPPIGRFTFRCTVLRAWAPPIRAL